MESRAGFFSWLMCRQLSPKSWIPATWSGFSPVEQFVLGVDAGALENFHGRRKLPATGKLI